MAWTVASSGRRAGLHLFTLETQTKNQKRLTKTILPPVFDSLQHFNNYLTRRSARQHRLSPACLPLRGATARQNQTKSNYFYTMVAP